MIAEPNTAVAMCNDFNVSFIIRSDNFFGGVDFV